MDFQTYEKQLREPFVYSPIDISVAFYGFCSYQHIAWDYVFKKIRDHYPDAPIFLINDGFDQYDYSEMAKKYNCVYIPKAREICLHYPEISASHEFLNRTKEVCDLAGTDWLIHLHPDVICQGKISYYPPSELCGVGAGSISGVSNNNWDSGLKVVADYIRQYQPNVELNGWGWCGGSIVNIKAFNVVYDSLYGPNKKFSLEDIREKTWINVTEHEDTMMSVLFALNGYSYRIWKDNPEHQRFGPKEGAFLHGYKEHYDFKKQGLSDAEYFARVRFQNISKRKDAGLLEGENYSDNNQLNI